MILNLQANTRLVLDQRGLQVDLDNGSVTVRVAPPRARRFRGAALATLLLGAGLGGGYVGAQQWARPIAPAEAAQPPAALVIPPPPGAAPQNDAFGPG